MTNPTFYTQPKFSPNIQTTYGGFQSQSYGQVAHGFMEWDSGGQGIQLPSGYSSPATVAFQFNPSTLSVSYANQSSSNVVTDWTYSVRSASATPLAGMQQSLTFALLYDRTYELWGSFNASGTNSATATSGTANPNDPAQAGVGVDILAMQQFTGMLDAVDTGTGNAPATAGPISVTGKIQYPLFFIPSWIYFGANANCLYYYGFVTDWSVQITQWTQYMSPMRCVMNVNFTLLPTPAPSGLAAGPGPTSQFWSASPIPVTGAGAAGAATPGTTTGTAGGTRTG